MKAGNDLGRTYDLVRHFYAAYPARSTVVLLSISFAALAEGVGVAALLPLLNLVIESNGTSGILTSYMARTFALVGLEPSIGGLLIVIVGMITLKSLLMLMAMAQVGYSAAHVAMDLRLRVIRTLLDAHWQYFVNQRTGNLASAVSVEPARAATAYVSACRVLAGVLQVLIYVALSVAISWEISIAGLIVGAFGLIALNRFVAISRRAGHAQTEHQKSFISRLLQGLEGMKLLKAMALEGNLRPLVESDIQELNHVQRTLIFSGQAISEAHEIIRILAVAAGLYLFLTIWNETADSIFVMILLFARTLQKVSSLQSYYQIVAREQPAFAFLCSAIVTAESAKEPDLGGKAPRFGSAISLRDVTFSYGHGNVLNGASMTIPARKFVAVVGSSGAGKTTIVDLIIGLHRPQQGEVWIDDLPMSNVDVRAWRRMIGYVPQETFLFHDTVMANVTLGAPGFSRAEVIAALRRAEAWDFVAALPEDVDTVVGERGTRLSGGQRQRIAIARALIRDPVLLILDEATTALDPQTEAGIVTTVRRLTGRVTVLSISHQSAMTRVADIVYRVGHGVVRSEVPDQATGRADWAPTALTGDPAFRSGPQRKPM